MSACCRVILFILGSCVGVSSAVRGDSHPSTLSIEPSGVARVVVEKDAMITEWIQAESEDPMYMQSSVQNSSNGLEGKNAPMHAVSLLAAHTSNGLDGKRVQNRSVVNASTKMRSFVNASTTIVNASSLIKGQTARIEVSHQPAPALPETISSYLQLARTVARAGASDARWLAGVLIFAVILVIIGIGWIWCWPSRSHRRASANDWRQKAPMFDTAEIQHGPNRRLKKSMLLQGQDQLLPQMSNLQPISATATTAQVTETPSGGAKYKDKPRRLKKSLLILGQVIEADNEAEPSSSATPSASSSATPAKVLPPGAS